MKIPLTRNEVRCHAERYLELPSYRAGVRNGQADEQIAMRFRTARDRGYMVIDDLRHTAVWKYPGGALVRLVRENTPREVEEVSQASFVATTERLRIGALLALHGVSWPMASVILHFAFPDCYPILDKRVMRTVGAGDGYNFGRWVEYTDFCRKESKRFGITMRDLDRALWTYDRDRGAGG